MIDSIARSLACCIDSSPSAFNILICPCVYISQDYAYAFTEPTTVSEEDYVSHLLDTGKGTEQVGLHCSGHSGKLLMTSTCPYA
jgi:hypothetical protein